MRLLAVLAAISLAMLFSGLDRVGFLDQREARDAGVARELMQRFELLTPVLGGEPLFEKPLLGYAPDVLGEALTPGSPVGPRGIKAALAVLLVLWTGALGWRHFGRRAGFAAGAVLATSLAPLLAVRSDGLQVLGSLLGWLGAGALADALLRGAGSRPLLLGYSSLAVALVAVGPLAALWPLLAIALHLVLVRSWAHWRALRPLPGLALMLGLALPWYGAALERHGAALLLQVPFFPYAAGSYDAWLLAPARALGFLIVGLFPWSAWLPGAAFTAPLPTAREARTPGRLPAGTPPHGPDAAGFFLVCLVAGLAPAVLGPASPPTAVLPALPAAALLCGRLMERHGPGGSPGGGWTGWATRVLALGGSVAAVMLALAAPRLGEGQAALRAAAAFLLVTSWGPLLAAFLGRPALGMALFGLPVAVGTPLVTLRLLPALEGRLNSRAVAEALESTAPPDAPLLVAGPPAASLRLSVRRHLVRFSRLEEEARAFAASDGFAYLAFPAAREEAIARAAGWPLEVLARTPGTVLARVRVSPR